MTLQRKDPHGAEILQISVFGDFVFYGVIQIFRKCLNVLDMQ